MSMLSALNASMRHGENTKEGRETTMSKNDEKQTYKTQRRIRDQTVSIEMLINLQRKTSRWIS